MHAQRGSEDTGGVFETYQELEAFGPGVLCIIHYDPFQQVANLIKSTLAQL
jgi:hypothetical protein